MLPLALNLPGPQAAAQILSPGKLSRAHEGLAGITNCTSCHAVGRPGVQNTRCLNCHEPLRMRIAEGRGFHAAHAGENCADCHKDHFGEDFQIVRFDTAAFDHREAGFDLLGRHANVACRSCHQPSLVTDPLVRRFKGRNGALDRTYLGLGRDCAICHAESDPHGNQFAGTGCGSCHNESSWNDLTEFDHQRTDFQLTGLHAQVACTGCHVTQPGPGGHSTTRYRGISAASCASCHADPHDGQMGPRCSDCHATGGWLSFELTRFEQRFDHDRTGFQLVGAHAEIACIQCHRQRDDERIRLTFARASGSYPKPASETCESCHVDVHDGSLASTPGGTACDGCHTQQAWLPVLYDVDRHDRETTFSLVGAHAAVTCANCHHEPSFGHREPVFDFAGTACADCHRDDDPHQGQFGETACEACHSETDWRLLARFDHDATDFPLVGRHTSASCIACHAEAGGKTVYRGTAQGCADCHADVDPHATQFADRSCDDCHDAASFHMESFDHERTGFSLGVAHAALACLDCHPTEEGESGLAFVRFTPIPAGCSNCHVTR